MGPWAQARETNDPKHHTQHRAQGWHNPSRTLTSRQLQTMTIITVQDEMAGLRLIQD